MSENRALHAGKVNHASQTLSTRECKTAQTQRKKYWYAQWREGGRGRSKELGLYSKLTRADAERLLAKIVEKVNGAGHSHSTRAIQTFKEFAETTYLPVFSGNGRLRPP